MHVRGINTNYCGTVMLVNASTDSKQTIER